MKKLKNKKDFLAGGVVFRQEPEGILWLVIKLKANDLWVLPKGYILANESSMETAQRKVKEEAGAEGTVLGKVGNMKYSYIKGNQRYFKNVVFYLLEYLQESQGSLDGKVEEIDWLEFSEIKGKLTYDNEKEILEKGHQLLFEK